MAHRYVVNGTLNAAMGATIKTAMGTHATTGATTLRRGEIIYFAGSIAQATPLIWDRAANCCHPVSGTLNLSKGSKSATLVFGLPCGSVTVNGEAKTLGPCPS